MYRTQIVDAIILRLFLFLILLIDNGIRKIVGRSKYILTLANKGNIPSKKDRMTADAKNSSYGKNTVLKGKIK